ncbi:hypothetical protein [Nocardia sp. NPDC058666]
MAGPRGIGRIERVDLPVRSEVSALWRARVAELAGPVAVWRLRWTNAWRE